MNEQDDASLPDQIAPDERSSSVVALFEPLLAHDRVLRRIIDDRLSEWLLVRPLDSSNLKGGGERAQKRLGSLPERSVLTAWEGDLIQALEGAFDPKPVAVLISIMFDSIPKGHAISVDAYAEAAMLSLRDRGFAADIVADAIFRFWRKAKLLPTIFELLEECEEAWLMATHARRIVAKMLALRDDAVSVLAKSTHELDGSS